MTRAMAIVLLLGASGFLFGLAGITVAQAISITALALVVAVGITLISQFLTPFLSLLDEEKHEDPDHEVHPR